MSSFPKTDDDPISGGRDLKLARKAPGGNHTRGPTTHHNDLQ